MSLRALSRGIVDLLRGLFMFPASRPEAGQDKPAAAAAIEARYSRPRRCC